VIKPSARAERAHRAVSYNRLECKPRGTTGTSKPIPSLLIFL
jgi:hypothetical protein